MAKTRIPPIEEQEEDAQVEETTEEQEEKTPVTIEDFRKRREDRIRSNSRFWEYEGIQFRCMHPTPRIERESEVVELEEFNRLISEDVPTDSQLLEVAKKRGVFAPAEKVLGEDIDEASSSIRTRIVELEDQLEKLIPGDTDLERIKPQKDLWEECVNLSRELFNLRRKLIVISNARTDVTKNSAEQRAEFAKEVFLITKCTYVGMTDDRLWRNTEEYLDEPDSILVKLARANFNILRIGITDDNEEDYFRDRFIENKVLLEIGEEGITEENVDKINQEDAEE
jgi:hypothetical protein